MLGLFKRRYLLVWAAAGCVAAAVAALPPLHSAPFAGRVCKIGVRNHIADPGPSSYGRVDSLAVEVVSDAARRAGIRLEWVECPEGPDYALRSKKVDLWPTVVKSPERARYLYVTDPWMVVQQCLVSKGPPKKNWQGVPVAYGLGQASTVAGHLPGAALIHKQGEAAAIQSVCSGQADAAFVLEQSLASLLLNRPEGCSSADFRVTPLHGSGGELGIGAVFDSAPIADELRTQIGRMAADGALTGLFSKYSIFSSSETKVVYELIDAERRSRLLAYGAAGMFVALAVLFWQVRRAREARRAAVRANSAKSDFLANMSHEIRTPLNGIVGMAELLAGTPLTSDQREMTDVIRTSSEALLAIVNNILDFSRIEAGGIELEQIAFDLRVLVDSVVKLFGPQARAKGLKLETLVAGDVDRLLVGDPLRIRQVLTNLLGNAVKFTETGNVRVEVKRAASSALLFRVSDTGIGIDPRKAPLLFRPFTQADSATTRKYGGTGLGLSISHRLVSLMGGSIGVDSQPGCGATFWFLLPLVSANQWQGAMPAVSPAELPGPGPLLPPAPAGDRRVLIVEDNPVNQIVALRTVGSLGYAAQVASGGQQALDAFDHERFDVILMDCQMPGMDGYQATAEIRRRESRAPCGRRTPIVAMTANSIEGDREKCRTAGMDDYLPKPIRMAELSKTLARWTALAVPPPIPPSAPATDTFATPVPVSTTPPGPPTGR